jgi:hypothetical protein
MTPEHDRSGGGAGEKRREKKEPSNQRIKLLLRLGGSGHEI